MKIKLAIIDCIGLHYDGSTLSKRGIGGSESAIISVSRELAKLGFEVWVFNDCASEETAPGCYAGVEYRPIRDLLLTDYNFDIVISQRTVIPFTPAHLYDQVRQAPPRDYDPACFAQLQRTHQLKILWVQDTFVWGDHIVEHLVVNNHINEIFTLSDWHASYISSCNHGAPRLFEALNSKIFYTRNGINRWIENVDVTEKDPNLFVYNASLTKGMFPLVLDVWPKLKQHLPNAQLKIIGGYYTFRDSPNSPAEKQWAELRAQVEQDPSVEFTGVITQPEIAKILAKASCMLYPGAYPETSGISTLESINYNTPVIGTRFGAMEETGTEFASYFMDYPIEPNVLYTWINKEDQVQKYVELVLSVLRNPIALKAKQRSCDRVKTVSTWDTVALQWKQHFYHKLGLSLTHQEQQRVDWINYRVRRMFSRKLANPEERMPMSSPDVVQALPNQKTVRVAMVDNSGADLSIVSALKQVGLQVEVCERDPGDCDVVISTRLDALLSPTLPSASLRIYWMQNTHSAGDDILEDVVHKAFVQGVDQIWTSNDYQTNYIMNCRHPRMRSYEVLRRFVWTTRRGSNYWNVQVNIEDKDPNCFVFNAAAATGLTTLLNQIWPRVRARIPEATLTVVGGRQEPGFTDSLPTNYTDTSVTFVAADQLEQVYRQASYMLYPTEFAEPLGDIALQAICWNIPVLTFRRGALAETAAVCDLMVDYAAVPTTDFPYVDAGAQADRFADLVLRTHRDPVGTLRLMQRLEEIKKVLSWDSIALEWRQNIYSNLGLPVSHSERVQAIYTKSRYRALTGRRYSTAEEWLHPECQEPHVTLISMGDVVVDLVSAQNYQNYTYWALCGPEEYDLASQYVQALPEHTSSRIRVMSSGDALYLDALAKETPEESLVVILNSSDRSQLRDPDYLKLRFCSAP